MNLKGLNKDIEVNAKRQSFHARFIQFDWINPIFQRGGIFYIKINVKQYPPAKYYNCKPENFIATTAKI